MEEKRLAGKKEHKGIVVKSWRKVVTKKGRARGGKGVGRPPAKELWKNPAREDPRKRGGRKKEGERVPSNLFRKRRKRNDKNPRESGEA